MRGGSGILARADYGTFIPVASDIYVGGCDIGAFANADSLQTLEVATARVYNWDVVERRKDKADGKGEEQTKK